MMVWVNCRSVSRLCVSLITMRFQPSLSHKRCPHHHVVHPLDFGAMFFAKIFCIFCFLTAQVEGDRNVSRRLSDNVSVNRWKWAGLGVLTAFGAFCIFYHRQVLKTLVCKYGVTVDWWKMSPPGKQLVISLFYLTTGQCVIIMTQGRNMTDYVWLDDRWNPETIAWFLG